MGFIQKLKHRWQRWKEWRKLNSFGAVKQFLIFLGIIYNGWFESFVDWRKEE